MEKIKIIGKEDKLKVVFTTGKGKDKKHERIQITKENYKNLMVRINENNNSIQTEKFLTNSKINKLSIAAAAFYTLGTIAGGVYSLVVGSPISQVAYGAMINTAVGITAETGLYILVKSTYNHKMKKSINEGEQASLKIKNLSVKSNWNKEKTEKDKFLKAYPNLRKQK